MMVILVLALITSLTGSSLSFVTAGKVQNDIICDFVFADDCALNAGTQPEMQESMNIFSAVCEDFGLTIGTKKTEVMYQPTPVVPYTDPTITVEGQKLAVADKSTNLGSTFVYCHHW